MTNQALLEQFLNILLPVWKEEEEVYGMFWWAWQEISQSKRSAFFLQKTQEVSTEDSIVWEKLLIHLQERKPIQYFFGKQYFFGEAFQVNSNTLIPRSETEELVEWMLEVLPKSESIEILDIGTGTGCIAITLAKELPNAKISAIDVSERALEVAKNNAKSHQVLVDFWQKDILKEEISEKTWQAIVSNPPYVRELEKATLLPHVLQEEPGLALFVSDEDPLLFYRVIAQKAWNTLSSGGHLFYEINQYLGKETLALLQDMGYQNIQLRKDLKGNDRMIHAIKP
ncbi:MAG: peptide chain release factor N(5)-glutamine methyltransferase [Flavobacteriales bacterium]|nr:peptide chain release factor N(5)-glutamine methyltransferase [Flavobacteriales bacterium]